MSHEEPPPLPGEAPPVLTRLLQILGDEGLRPQVRKELHKAEASLARSQEIRFRWETLWRILGEILRDPRGLEPSVLQELQEELTWAQVRRGHPEIAPLVPPPKRSPSLPPLLLPELERRLRENREQLQEFLLGIPPNPPGIPQNPPEFPQIPPEFPEIPREFPKIPKEFPKIPREFPEIPREFPELRREFPELWRRPPRGSWRRRGCG
ncbi:zonadhesin-like [Pseudopipra pipra]|uniref:zonadhesin-like n=1 Tax=Pseudopipra pipra TaxID=415032 RepID=UPI0031398FEA